MPNNSYLEWYDDEEPGGQVARRELLRLIKHGHSKKITILLITIVISSFFIFRSLTKLPSYSSSITFRVIEQKRAIDTGERLMSKGAIIEYILDGILNHQTSLKLVQKHNIYKPEMKIDERLATSELVNDLDIRVFQNFFLETDSDNARSAHVKILYAAKDPTTSFAVVQDVARLIRNDALKTRKQETALFRSQTERALQESRRSLNEIETQMANIRVAQNTAHGQESALLRFKMRKLRGAQISIENQTQQVELSKAQNELRASMEEQYAGLTFYLVDYTRPRSDDKAGVLSKILTGILIFFFVLPFVGIIIGTFDPRVVNVNDVYRLGLEIVAHVPPFPGYECGTLEDRLKQENITLNS